MAAVEKLKTGLTTATGLPTRIRQYFADVWGEVTKVSFPGRKEVYGTTIVVIVTVFIFGFYLWLVDLVLNYGIQQLFSFFSGTT